MTETKVNLDHWRERFFGWFPYDSVAVWFVIGNVIYLYAAVFLMARIPPYLVFGWWPIHHVVLTAGFGTWAAVMWGVYYFYFWPRKDEAEELDRLDREEIQRLVEE